MAATGAGKRAAAQAAPAAPARSEVAACTCMKLRKLTRRMTQIYDGCLAEAGITGPQFGLLAVINARPGISIGALAEYLVMDPTTLTRNLRPLQVAGLVDVAAEKTDRRRRTITLAAKGRKTFEAALPHWRRAQAQTAERLGASDLATLAAALDRSMSKLAAI